MGLKAMAQAALQQCAVRTIERTTLKEAPAHSPPKNESVRTLSDGEQSVLAIAEQAIARAALTDEQKASRLADLRRDPAIARFWAMAWPEASEVIALAPPPAQTTGRCVECVSFKLAGMGHRCSHADRVLPNEPPIVECLADNQCHRFVHWHPAQSKDSTS